MNVLKRTALFLSIQIFADRNTPKPSPALLIAKRQFKSLYPPGKKSSQPDLFPRPTVCAILQAALQADQHFQYCMFIDSCCQPEIQKPGEIQLARESYSIYNNFSYHFSQLKPPPIPPAAPPPPHYPFNI